MTERTDSKQNDKVAEAVKTVQEAISSERKRYEDMADTEEESPVLVEGETVTGHYVQTHADPSDIARILLKHDYAMYRILGEDAPQEMWDDIAGLVGFETASSVDI